MAGYELKALRIQELFGPLGWMSQPVILIHWNTEEVESNVREGVDLLARRENAGKEQKLPSSVPCIQAASRRCGPD